MNNRRSSSRAESDASAPRRGPWPWLLAAGPAAVVAASLFTAYLALTRNDVVVSDDYYKLGLTINRRLAARAPLAPDPAATVVIGAGGEVRVRLHHGQSAPARLRMTLLRPGGGKGAQAVALEPVRHGEWAGVVDDTAAGRRVVTLESEAWRLPVTVIDGLPATIRLGATDSNR